MMYKKIAIVAIISLGAISCNKDAKTNQKTTDSIELKGTEGETTNLNSTGNLPEELIAIKENNGVYTQSFVLAKGQTYPLTTFQRNIQSVTGPDGTKATATSNSTDQMSFTVVDFKDGIYNIDINLLGKSSSQSAQGKSVSISTSGPAPQDPQLKMMWTMNKALVGNKLQMNMSEKGEVLSVKGFESIYKKIASAAQGEIKDEKMREQFIGSFKESFSEKTIKEQVSKNLQILPTNGAKIGQSWNETENASPDGGVKLTTKFTLAKVENGLVNISVTGGIPKKSDKRSQEGMTHTISSELNQSGTITLDQKTGWVKNQNISIKTKQSESLSDGKKTQSMQSETNSTVIVNPEK